MVEAMDDAQSFVKDMDFDAFVLDKETVYAINRALEIIGEASKPIPVR